MARIAVLGGGLAGLTVAFRQLGAGNEVVLFERALRLGGQLWTAREDGFVVEHGAEGFVAGSEAVAALAMDLGIGDDLVGQTVTRSFGFDGTQLVSLAPGEAAAFLGFQVPRDELGRGIRTFRVGMGQLSDALANAIATHSRLDLRTGVAVRSITPHADGFQVVAADQATQVEAVVVATTAATASEILAEAYGPPAAALRDAATLSSCTVTLAYPRDAIEHPLDGTGFVVAAAHQVDGMRACTFITSKFADRAPPGFATVRVFFRPEGDDLAALGDDAWVGRAERRLGAVLPIHGRPVRAWVSRWSKVLPVFSPHHTERVRALEDAFAGGRIRLAGSAFHGSGIDAAVRSAEAAAR